MIRYFEGVAGTGKTTRLIKAVKEYISQNDLCEGQMILAITFMHGSRKRLHQKLSEDETTSKKFECLTIDSFAKRIAERWRSLISETNCRPNSNSTFQETLLSAIHATRYSDTVNWISRSYPIIIVDEFQDCSDFHIQLISNIEPSVIIFAAVDEFQDLNCNSNNCASDYLKKNGKGEILTEIHRTKRSGILEAARLLRDGRTISCVCNKRGCGIHLRIAYNYNVAIHHAAKHFLWYGSKNVAFLTPTNPDKVPTFTKVIDKLQIGPIKLNHPNKTVGPFKINMAVSIETTISNEISRLHLNEIMTDNNCISYEAIRDVGDTEAAIILKEFLKRKWKLKGISEVDVTEVIQHIKKTMLIRFNMQTMKTSGIEALTVRQAKNREFESVIFLWPYSVPPSIDSQRRLLYNGITRAKNQVTILIEDFEKPSNAELFGELGQKDLTAQ
jgi:superfamily I DNA/RNA helicase